MFKKIDWVAGQRQLVTYIKLFYVYRYIKILQQNIKLLSPTSFAYRK